MNNLLLSQWLLTVALLQYTGNVNGQFIAVPLTCSGNTVTYRCIVNGGGMNGITIWRVGGSSECTLAHRSAGNNARCGPQNAFTATPGSGFGTSATSYSSTLSGTATPTLNGTLVECFGPGVTRDADNMVGNSTLQILDPPSVSTLSCVDLFGDVSGAVNVTVNWTLSEGDSADFYLINITSNAPQIPYGGLLNITGSITQYQLTGFLAGYEYNITMHGVTENCGGQDSNTLRITLQVPATPMTDVCAVYDMRNETLQIIESSWNEVGNVTVSEHCTNGQDIQANYELSYKTESGTLITTCYVDGKECSHDTLSCHHELQSNTEDSRCQPPASHFSGDSLTVSVTARNIVGKSNPAVSRIISGRNVDLRVGIDATNLSSIFVECILNQRGFNCTIEYGTDPSYTNLDYTDTSSTQGRVTTITLSQELRGDTTYYYIVSAESISQCVRVLGRFQARCNETDLTNQSGTLNTASCTDIGFMNSSFISGGVVCYNGTTIGSRAVYICNDGFLIEGDEATRVCQKDGIWNGSIPQCIPNSNRIVGGVVGGVGVLLIVIIAIILICVLQIYRCKATKSKDLGSVRLIEGTDGSTHSEPQEVGSNDVPVPKKSIIDAIQGGHQSAVMGWLKKKDTKVNECIGGSAYYQPHAVADGTALHWAVYYGRLEIAELLLRYGADPHERAKGGTTVLHWACKSEKSDDQVLQFVFNIHVKSKHPEPLVNVPDSRGLTPLHVACSDNNKELVQLLLNAGADLDARDSNGATPKDRLSEQGKNYQEILDLLRECHFVLEKHIIHAIESGDKSTIEKWLQEEETTKVNKYRGGSDYPGRHAVSNGTALHWAVYYKQLEIAQLLIDQGADPHERAKGGATVLHWACKSNKSDEELLQFVLNIHVKTKGAGPLVNVPDSRDLTPLHVACSDSNKELVELLLKAGANPAARDSFNATPKNRLSEGETYQDIVDLLDKYHSLPMKSNPGVQQHTFEESDSSDAQKKVLEQYIIDSIQRGNQSPINQWLEKDDTDVNECRGGNANYQSFAVANGTALHWAIYYGQLEIAQLLLRNGADPYQRAVGDETVLHWASQSKIRNEELLQLLFSVKTKSPGPLINVPDNGGLTPLHFACSSNNLKLVQLFMEAGAHPEARDHYHATPKDRLRDEYPNYQEIVDLLDKGYTSIRKGGSVHQERTTEGETAGLEVRAGSKSEQTEDEGKYKSSSTSTPSERETKV